MRALIGLCALSLLIFGCGEKDQAIEQASPTTLSGNWEVISVITPEGDSLNTDLTSAQASVADIGFSPYRQLVITGTDITVYDSLSSGTGVTTDVRKENYSFNGIVFNPEDEGDAPYKVISYSNNLLRLLVGENTANEETLILRRISSDQRETNLLQLEEIFGSSSELETF